MVYFSEARTGYINTTTNNSSFKSISIKNQEDTGNDITKYRVQKIIAFSEREALVATRRDGVYVLDYQAMRLKRLFSGSNNILQGAYLSSNGYIYLSFWGQGLFCYEKTGKFIKRYTKENYRPNKQLCIGYRREGRVPMAGD